MPFLILVIEADCLIVLRDPCFAVYKINTLSLLDNEFDYNFFVITQRKVSEFKETGNRKDLIH